MNISEVRPYHGVPTLFINGEPVPGMAYITYFRQDACYRAFADAGYRLFSIPVFFGDQGINAVSGIHPFEPGIFRDKDRADFSGFDQQVRQVLEACPDAFIFPRVNMSMPGWWERENPEECNDSGVNGGAPRSCFASDKWFHDTLAILRQFLEYTEHASCADRIVAYMLADGNTEEWFPFDQRGGIGPASRQKYPGKSDPEEPGFRRTLSHITADAICRFAQETKRLTGGRKAVGCFYGYTFEVPFWHSAHHALREVLQSPDVDFLCSPASYTTRNAPGLDWPDMVPVDSLQAAGKLYFMEDDTRTCRTKLLKDCHPGACPEHTYEQPVWLGPDTEEKSVHLLRMNLAHQLADGHALWWFDMWGGWFDSPAMMNELAEYRRIAERFMRDDCRKSPAECALWIDETAYAYADPAKENGLAKWSRVHAGQCGVPFDFYEIGDWAERGMRYKANVFVVHAETPAVTAAVEDCRKRGIPVMVMRPGAVPSVDELRKFCTDAGAHCFCATGDAVYIAPHFAAVHAASEGMKTITLKSQARVTPLLNAGEPFVTDRITVQMRLGETRLYRLDDIHK